MATIVNNPAPSDRVVEVERVDSTGGWAIAVIILVAVIVGLFLWIRYYRVAPAAAPAQPTNASINVTLPSNPSSGDNSGGTGGNTDTGGTGTAY